MVSGTLFKNIHSLLLNFSEVVITGRFVNIHYALCFPLRYVYVAEVVV